MISLSNVVGILATALFTGAMLVAESIPAIAQPDSSITIDSLKLNSNGSIKVNFTIDCSEPGTSDGAGVNIRQPDVIHWRVNGGVSTNSYSCGPAGTSLTVTVFPCEDCGRAYTSGKTVVQIFTGIYFASTDTFLSLTTDQTFRCSPNSCIPTGPATTTIVEL